MKSQTLPLRALRHALLCAAVGAPPTYLNAQEIAFGRISAFESMGSEPAQRGALSKKLVDDAVRHDVFLTIWDSDTAGYKQLVPRDLGAEHIAHFYCRTRQFRSRSPCIVRRS
jgi:hypothetical protein